MKIANIGAGNIGGTLTRRLRALGQEVFVANSRGPETLADLAGETGAKAVTREQAARSGEGVIVTIPQGTFPTCPEICLPLLQATWWSSIPATLIRASVTVTSRKSRG